MISIQTMLLTRVMLPSHVDTCPSRPGAAKHCVRGEAWILTSTSATVTHFPGSVSPRPDCQHSHHSANIMATTHHRNVEYIPTYILSMVAHPTFKYVSA